MSVTTASADPPPLLFSSQSSPPSPPFTRPQTQPSSLPSQAQMADQEDVDMTTSLTLPPLGQNHDRQRVDMDIDVDLNPAVEWVDLARHELADRGSGEAREDAMDTRPDAAREPAPADRPASQTLQTSPSTNQSSSQTGTAESHSPEAAISTEPTTVLSSTTPTSQETTAPAPDEPTALASPNSPQPDQHREADEDDSSSDDENMSHSWHEIREDQSAPDERELKDIVDAGETSALNHAHWESKAFTDLKEPEYKPGASGRIQWLIERFNGTKERPNTEVVMRSEPVRIGAYEWRIKLYPRGNDSEYLSVYIENTTVEIETSHTEVPKSSSSNSVDASKSKATEAGKRKAKSPTKPKPSPQNIQPLLPLLDAPPVRERPSVAAQISIVMYNPAEPRVNHQGISLHRFCPNAPDFGFRHFYGTHYEIAIRRRGMRAAMLRHDQLAFTAYIRIIDDATGCLGEHTENNPWDSYIMTGICGLSVPLHTEPGGNLISVVSAWMLLKPFRQLLYDARAPNPALGEYGAPKPLLLAFQKILYMLRSYSPRSVSLEGILQASEWYGLSTEIKALDALYLADVLRTKLQQELEGTKFAGRLTEIFGPAKNPATGTPSYRVPVKQGQQGQHLGRAVADMSDLVDPSALPQVLQLELVRQEFDTEKRTWKKVVDKMRLDDHITIRDIGYTLYGFIVHKDHLQSGLYCSVLRPRGPCSKWFTFLDSKDGYQVRCLTRRAAVAQHEGRSIVNSDKQTSEVAYLVYYIRDDIATHAFQATPEPWNVPPNVIPSARAKLDTSNAMSGDANAVEEGTAPKNGLENKPESVTLFALCSPISLAHEGPGLVDIFGALSRESPHVFEIKIDSTTSTEQIQQLLADKVDGVKNPRSVVYWHVFAIGPYNLGHASLANSQDVDLGCKNPSGERICSQRKDNPDTVSLLWVFPPSDAELQTPSKQVADDTPMRGADEEDAVQTLIALAGSGTQTSSQRPNTDSQMGGTQDAQPSPIPGLNMANENSPGDAMGGKPENWLHIVLKLFNAETQSLQTTAAFVERKDTEVDTIIRKWLNLNKDQKYTLYEELETRPWTRELTGLTGTTNKTFSAFQFPDLTVLIAHLTVPHPPDTIPEDHATSLAAKGHFSNPDKYIEHATVVQNFSHLASGTLKLNYFGSEFYSGDILHGLPHGTGTATYHSGHTYTGSFALGQRHGHGLMLYATGDSYEGDWRAGLRHGTGTFVERETGNSYAGGWKADKRFGVGTTMWKRVQEVEHVCRVCWMEEADTAFYDCGHVVACGVCAGQVDTCPVCRKRVLARLKLFFVT